MSPSALSRTIRLLEKALGVTLFNREGRAIRLTPTGQTFLLAVRDAMRLVDDGLAHLSETTYSDPFQITVAGPFNYTLPRILEALRERCPGLVVSVRTYAPDEANASLNIATVTFLSWLQEIIDSTS